jgi:hypothetical protein
VKPETVVGWHRWGHRAQVHDPRPRRQRR